MSFSFFLSLVVFCLFVRHRGARGHPTMAAVLRRGGGKHAGGRKQGTGEVKKGGEKKRQLPWPIRAGSSWINAKDDTHLF